MLKDLLGYILTVIFSKIAPFLTVYAIGIIYLSKEFIKKKLRMVRSLKETDTPQQEGKYAIITGGTSGIGLAVLHKLASLGMNVIVGSLSGSKEKFSIQECQKKYPNILLENWSLDLSSMDAVEKFAKKFLKKGYPLHLLILNAGIMLAPYELTQDGFEKHLSVNYLGHCLLTKLLLKQLKKSGTSEAFSRIVWVSSSCHFVGQVNFDDLQSQKVYSPYFSYSQSKVAGVMFTLSLQHILESENSCVTINCLHPGVAYTGLYKYVWWANRWTGCFFKTPEEGAETVLYAALSPEMEGIGGKYLEECSISNPSKYSKRIEDQDHLWEVTWELLKSWLTEFDNK